MKNEGTMFGNDAPAMESGEDRRGRGRRKWILGGLVVLFLLIVGVVSAMLLSGGGESQGGDAAEKATATSTSQLPTVSVAIPGRFPIQHVVTGTGSIAAKREMPVGVSGEGGMVTRVLVEPGDWVRAGQVLATVDRSVQVETIASLAAQVRVARANADIAQSEYERAQRLVGRGFVSQADLERKAATRDSALAQVGVAQAQLQEARARAARLEIRAPAEGLVLTRDVEPGQIVSSGSGTLFRVAMGGQLELRVQLAEGDLQQMRVGDRADVTPVGVDQTFTGTVWQVSPVIDPTTRQGIARVQVAYNPALRPGGFASARIVSGGIVAPQLPQSAVQSDQRGNYVFILNANNEAVRRAITTGDVSDQGVAITSGLTGRERVVLTAGQFLNEGQKVIPNLVNLRNGR